MDTRTPCALQEDVQFERMMCLVSIIPVSLIIPFVMGMGVFSAVYFGVPGRVYFLWGWRSFLLCILGFKLGYNSYGDGGLFCCVIWSSR